VLAVLVAVVLVATPVTQYLPYQVLLILALAAVALATMVERQAAVAQEL
jgi:hypothetical protein